jgi:hypothetical protein
MDLISHTMEPKLTHVSGAVNSQQECSNCGLGDWGISLTKTDQRGMRWFTRLNPQAIPCKREFYPSGPDWSEWPV